MANKDNPHRYVIMDGGLWRISYDNYQKALESVKAMQGRDIVIDRDQYRMVRVDDIPPNWNTLSSAEAEALLMGMSARKAAIVEGEQGRIERSATMPETPTEAAQRVINPSPTAEAVVEGEQSETERIGQDEYQTSAKADA